MKLGLPTDADNLPKRIWLLEWTYDNYPKFGPTVWPYALRRVRGRQKYVSLTRSQRLAAKCHIEQIEAIITDVLGTNHSDYPWTITNTELELLQNAIMMTAAISHIEFEPIYVQQRILPTTSSCTIDNILNTFVRIC